MNLSPTKSNKNVIAMTNCWLRQWEAHRFATVYFMSYSIASIVHLVDLMMNRTEKEMNPLLLLEEQKVVVSLQH